MTREEMGAWMRDKIKKHGVRKTSKITGLSRPLVLGIAAEAPIRSASVIAAEVIIRLESDRERDDKEHMREARDRFSANRESHHHNRSALNATRGGSL